MSLFKVETSMTAASGAVSFNTLKIIGGLCRQVLVYASDTDTTFSATLVDNKSRTVREWGGVTYMINDLIAFPVEGIYTVSIVNATTDNRVFTFFLGVQEL